MEEIRKAPMERYTITVPIPPGAASIRLLIPFPPTSSVSALAAEVKKRASRSILLLDASSDLILHLGDATGPILGDGDLLEDVIIDPKAEFITATLRNSPISTGLAPSLDFNDTLIQQTSSSTSSAREIKVRVITPVYARAHKDIRAIPLLTCATITGKSTLRELKFQISNHLQIPILDIAQPSQECNCSFARQIDERALRSDTSSQNPGEIVPGSELKFILVYGQSQVKILKTETTAKTSLIEAVRAELGGDGRSKETSFVGGTTLPNASGFYSKLPVLSVCSRARHDKSSGEVDQSLVDQADLDLHTSEAPIEISSLNMDLSIDELGLTECAINGVINIYVVERKISSERGKAESGKDAIFANGSAWIHPVPQTMRGMAMLLSSLRVFTDRIGAKKMEHPTQDAVLHIFNLLTRFPPAVRTIHILMNDKTPRACERAALAQALYEVLKDMVPVQLIKSDMTRLFEGARLLFGLILEKAKHVKLKADVQMPYISSLKVLDLRNTFTMEPISNAVQTPFGLVEKGYYEAFKEGGILYWKTGEQPLSALPLDERTRRVSLLGGGIISQITVLDLNILSSISGYGDNGDVDGVIPFRELSDLNHLSALSARNELSVLAPSTLPSAEAPALTLDREGLLAVYVGRAPCAMPGKDISIFRPTKRGEETIDVAIVTQLLVPILKTREAEGTAIFDAYGDGFQRKFRAPGEIIMVCVDCSSSMAENTDFMEIRDSDSEDEDDEAEDSDDSMDMGDHPQQGNAADETSYFCATLDEMKKSISEHESFLDMLYIIHDSPTSKHRDVACKVLEILSGLTSQQLSKSLRRLDDLKKRVTIAFYRAQAAIVESEISKLKTFAAGLNIHRQALADFLIYRSSTMEFFDNQWTWSLGGAIPKAPKKSSNNTPDPLLKEQFSVPDEFICPISREVMDDPVLASDGFAFERNAIERWFQIRKSSPLTGLVLDNTDLRANGQLANQVKDWINGSDLVQSVLTENATPSSSRIRLSSGSQHMMTIRFFSRLGLFSRQVPRTLPIDTLYRLAFRGMKGRHSKFELHFKNALLESSGITLASANIRDNSVIHIDIPETRSADASQPEAADADLEELCLIKVYKYRDQMAFSYWAPRRTNVTFASTIFKYWRYLFKTDPRQYISDLVPWTGMTDQGDGRMCGNPHEHWERLSEYLNRHHATGQLKNESLCGSDSTDSSDDEDLYGMEDQHAVTPLVLKIFLAGPPKSTNKSGRNLSRLDVLKSMFDAFVNRLLAYNYQTHMGLITFQSSATVSQKITYAIENFRHKVNGMNAHGDTALWDALALANDQLSEYAQKFPDVKKRIICISDGEDTKSKQRSSDVSWSLFQNKVVVDSFCLGYEDNIDLRTISYLSGGYKFTPQSLEQSMLLCEMEPVLNQLERPLITPPREALSHGYDPHLRFVFAKDKAVPEVVTADIFPQRKEHPNVNDHFVLLTTVAGNNPGGVGSEPINAHSNSNLRTSRILVEIRNIVANPHPHYDVYLSESNMSFWKVIMQGPPESAYSTGTFVLYIDMEEDYPAFPPKCRFTTPIYHPNINRHGRVCHSILDRNWTSDTSNIQLINTIYSLLLVPEFSDPVNSVVTLNFHWDEVAFRDEVKEHIHKHATKSREDWRVELLAE
ncbi:hypothetical protein N431DRAFT_549163 [Stipitochalara longipes BDJ]|nr:hypothetical protein N431DRAFT_549163 [Stipitochalara longipes BDJ]